jgi:hypothetical protein
MPEYLMAAVLLLPFILLAISLPIRAYLRRRRWTPEDYRILEAQVTGARDYLLIHTKPGETGTATVRYKDATIKLSYINQSPPALLPDTSSPAPDSP